MLSTLFSVFLHRCALTGAIWISPLLLLTAQTDTLRLLFAGDIMGHAPQIKSAETAGGKKYDYTPCFSHISPLIERADVAIGNLELTLPGKPPYTGYPMFRSPDALADALKTAGFDLLVTANNHSNDSHGGGVIATIETIRRTGLQQTGTFLNAADRKTNYPLMLYKNGFKVAILNYTYDTNGVPTDAPTIVNLIDTTQIAADLYEARARKPHYIIVVMHWGIEYQLKENAEQRSLARMLIRNGADLIIGMHPHVVQPIRLESAKGPDGALKEVLTVYSLGNFISNQRQPHTDGGIMFQAELLKTKGSAQVRLGHNGYIPVWRYMHRAPNGKTIFYTLPVARLERQPDLFPGMSPAARSSMLQYARQLRQRIEYHEWKK